MIDRKLAEQAAQILVARRLSGEQGERLSENHRPKNLEDALAIQAAVSNLWCTTQDDSIGGWKCLLPSPEKQVLGPIFTSTINTVPPIALRAPSGNARVEPELAFILGKDLPARDTPYTPAEIDAAIARVHLALELIHGRYHPSLSIGFPESLADGLVNQGLFIGPAAQFELADTPGEFTIEVRRADGRVNTLNGGHPNNDPRAPVYWLVEFLRSRGQPLFAGQAIITGSFAGIIEIPLNELVEINYANIGTMTVEFIAQT
jgi:2-keto-4-pentenoate hydratase